MHVVVTAGERLQDHIVDARPHEVHIDAHLLEMIAKRSQTPLKADVVLLGVLILHKLIVLLVNRIVREVHVAIVLVELSRVALTGEACQALLVDVHS